MTQFNYTFVCEKCGGEFYSKLDPSNWRHKVCNACSGKQYKDYPVKSSTTYTPKPVPTTQAYVPTPKKEFNTEEYVADIIETYIMLKGMLELNKLVIPEENICSWVTSIMIQKGKM